MDGEKAGVWVASLTCVPFLLPSSETAVAHCLSSESIGDRSNTRRMSRCGCDTSRSREWLDSIGACSLPWSHSMCARNPTSETQGSQSSAHRDQGQSRVCGVSMRILTLDGRWTALEIVHDCIEWAAMVDCLPPSRTAPSRDITPNTTHVTEELSFNSWLGNQHHTNSSSVNTSTAGANADSAQRSLECSGIQLYTWGSNKNYSLGQSDGSDRTYPDRIDLVRLFINCLDMRSYVNDRHFPRQICFSKYHAGFLTEGPQGANLLLAGFGKSASRTQLRLIIV